MVANDYFWNGSSIYLRSGDDGLLVKNWNDFFVVAFFGFTDGCFSMFLVCINVGVTFIIIIYDKW